MNDVLVTIKIPESMHSTLESLAVKKHYLDSSELIKEVLRKKVDPEVNDKDKVITQLENLLSELKK